MLAILAIIASLLMRLQNPVALDDGLRHFAMGRLIAAHGINAADWGNFLYAGYFAHHSVDPWFLADALFAALSKFSVVTALKIFTLATIAALLTSFLYAFRVLKVAVPTAVLLLVMLAFFESIFFYRLLVARPYPLITALFVVVLAASFERTYWLVALSLTLSVLLSHLFIFPLLAVVTCIAWRWWLGEKSDTTRLALWSAAAIGVGFFLHPHPVEYLLYIVDVFLRIPFQQHLEMGTEMHSGVLLGLRTWAMVAVVALLHATLKKEGMTRSEYERSRAAPLAVLTVLFALMFSQWSRAVDFLWPLLILLSACVLTSHPGLFGRTLERILPRSVRVRPAIVSLIVILLCAVSFTGIQGALLNTDDQRSISTYVDALQKIPFGSRVLNLDWHFFMAAAAMRPDLKYAAGMDPSFTSFDSPKAQQLIAMTMSPDFQNPEREIEAGRWLADLTKEYPSEYLVMYTARHQLLSDAIVAQLGLKNISGDEAVAVFDLSR